MVFGVSEAFARANLYAPGETLNPDCAPGDTNCSVAQVSVNTTTNFFGIGTTSPYAKLSVVGGVVAAYFTATTTATSTFTGGFDTAVLSVSSTTATSTIPGGLQLGRLNISTTTATSTVLGGFSVGSSDLVFDFSSGVTSINNLEIGAMSFDANSGSVSWADMPVTSSASAGTIEAYSAQVDGTQILTVYSESDGSGGIQYPRVGINKAAPAYGLDVVGTVAINGLSTAAGTPDAVCINSSTKEIVTNNAATCTVSSARFKHNIESVGNTGLSIVGQLRPVTFDLNDNNESHYGFIAEEVALVDHRLIFTERASTTPRGVRYEEITAVLAKAIQEQQVQLDAISAFIRRPSVETLRVGSRQAPSGITLFDEVTGDPYCLSISAGATKVASGECSLVTVAAASAASVTTPSSSSASSTPTAPADTEPPVITVTGNNPARIQINSSYIDLGATVTDNVDANLTATVSGDQIDTTVAGTSTVMYVAADLSGNTASTTREVIVE